MQQLIERLGADAVISFQRLRDVGLGAERQLDAAFRDEADRLEHREIEGIISCDDKCPVVGAHRHDVVLEHDLRRHSGADRVVDFGVRDLRE